MQLDLAKRIPALEPSGGTAWAEAPTECSERQLGPQALRTPANDKCRNDGLITTGRSAEEIDHRDLPLRGIHKPASKRHPTVGDHPGPTLPYRAGSI